MPANGLLLALERALEALLEENQLTSWNIKGGNFTTVTLKFRNQDGSHGLQTSTPRSYISYRTKPPSAVKRDSRRKQNWIDQKISKDTSNIADRSVCTQTKDAAVRENVDIDSRNHDVHFVCDSERQGANYMQGLQIENDSSEMLLKTHSCVTNSTSYSTTDSMHSKQSTINSHVTPIQKKMSMVQGCRNIDQSDIPQIKLKSHVEHSQQLVDEEINKWRTIVYNDGDPMCDQCLRKLQTDELIKECTCIEKRRICWLCLYAHGEPFCHDCNGSEMDHIDNLLTDDSEYDTCENSSDTGTSSDSE